MRFNSVWWASQLQQYYFGPRFAHSPVFLTTDEADLFELTRHEDIDDPVDSLASAVAAVVMPDFRFSSVVERSNEWLSNDADGPPPMLPLLALTVIAATRMEVGPNGGAPSFYKPFRELLGHADGVGAPGDFAKAIPECWELLDHWLTKVQKGASGISTIEQDEHFRNIGYSLRQSLFRGSDRQAIFRWFGAIGLDPGSNDTPGRELRKGLALWASRQGRTRLASVLKREWSRGDVERLLERMASDWDGSIPRLPSGQEVSRVRLRLPREGSGKFKFALVLDFDVEVENGHILKTEHGDHFTLKVDENSGGYVVDEREEMTKREFAQILEEGFDASSGELSASFDSGDIHAFRRGADPGHYPFWVTTAQIRFGEPHHLLVRSSKHRELLGWLKGERVEAAVRPELTEFLPDGWLFIPNVELDGSPQHSPPKVLADLLRRGNGTLFRLAGGLRVPGVRRAYFTGAPPRVALPADRSMEKLSIELIDSSHDVVSLSPGETEYPLNVLGLVEGTYRVRFGGSSIEFDLVDGIHELPPQLSEPVLHETADGRPLSGLRLAGVQPSLPVAVPWEDDYNQSVVFADGTQKPVLTPAWFSDVAGALSWSKTEIWCDDEPVWLIQRRPKGKHRAQLLTAIEPTLNKQSSAASVLLESVLIDDGDKSQALWDKYLEVLK